MGVGPRIAVGVAIAVTVVGCGSTTTATSTTVIQMPSASPPPPAEASPPPTGNRTSDQDRVLFSQLADDPAFRSVPRAELVEKAHQICYGFDHIGKTETISKMMDAGFPLDKAAKYAAAAAAAYCPEYLVQTR